MKHIKPLLLALVFSCAFVLAFPVASLAEEGTAVDLTAGVAELGSNAAASDQDDAARAELDKLAKSAKGTLEPGTYVIAATTGPSLALNVKGASTRNGANVNITASAMKESQKWSIAFDDKGYATVSSMCANTVLAVKDDPAKSGTNVVAATPDGSWSQKWIFLDKGDGDYQLVSALDKKLALHVAGSSAKSGANVKLAKRKASRAAQRWNILPVTPKVEASDAIEPGWYVLKSDLSKSYYLDVPGSRAKAGTALDIRKRTYAPGQSFRIKKAGKYYRIVSGVGTTFKVGMEGDVVPGAAATIEKPNSDETLFSLQKNKDGSYRLINVASGLALSISGGKAAKGVAVVGALPSANEPSQSFHLVKQKGLIADGFYRISTVLKGKKVLGIKGQSLKSGGKMQLQVNTKSLSQKWVIKAVPGQVNTYTIESPWSGKRLSSIKWKQVVQRKAKSSSKAQWWVPKWTKGAFVFKNVKTGQVLDVDHGKTKAGTQVVSWKSKGASNQRWKVTHVKPLETGVYVLNPASSNSLALAVAGDSAEGGANVQLAKKKSSLAQRWYYNAKDGTFTNLASQCVLDVYKSSTSSGANVEQWYPNGGANQKWTVSYAGKGTFEISSQVNGKLGLTAASNKAGANVRNSKYKATSKQRWRLAKQDKALTAVVKKTLSGINTRGVSKVGIDVSEWQGAINWPVVKASGIDFAIIRVGYGASHNDLTYLSNIKACMANNIKFGVYYYSTARTTAEARKEAKRTLNLLALAGVTSKNIDYCVYYDLEEPDMGTIENRKKLANITQAYMNVIEKAGYKGGVYSSTYWWNTYLTDKKFTKWERWVAHWGVSTCGYLGNYKIWQCTSDGSVPGIVGRVDMDVMY